MLRLVEVRRAVGASRATGQPPGWEHVRVTPRIEDLQVFPSDSWWNADVSDFPVQPLSFRFIEPMGETWSCAPISARSRGATRSRYHSAW